LLYFPYPREEDFSYGGTEESIREYTLMWYSDSSFYNHSNFSNMVRFTMDETDKRKRLNVLDYGGGGGQFALVCKSHFPEALVFITDINDKRLLKEWQSMNHQIIFDDFSEDETKFDFIFLNDVFEHVSDPLFVLKQLADKLKDEGKIFIDTPKQFWIYPLTKLFSKSLYKKVLTGTVSKAHLQIWSKKSFELVAKKAGLRIEKYKELSEYTMPAQFYIKKMDLKNPLLRLIASMFYRCAKYIARNKIMSVLVK
jgi:2-polyprenyl-3-methyl-5-hydroxy-6-metoxy-1,4-benzoquinol methylase